MLEFTVGMFFHVRWHDDLLVRLAPNSHARQLDAKAARAEEGSPSQASLLRRRLNSMAASGMVVSTPTATSVHPIFLRCSSLSLSESSRPTPAPKAPRVPANKASSGKRISVVNTTELLSCREQSFSMHRR